MEIARFVECRLANLRAAVDRFSSDLSDLGGDLGGGYPAVDHMFWARPDCMDVLYKKWTVEYQGSAFWDGDPAWQLLVRPTDLTVQTPPFNLYVRKDDFFPLRTTVDFPDGTKAVTDMTWLTVSGVVVPAKFTTKFSPAIGPLSGIETTFYNHQINPDLSNVDFSRQAGSVSDDNGSEDVQPVFEELYHGFDDDPIIVKIADSSGAYDRLSLTFTLYVEDASAEAPARSETRRDP